MARVIIGPGANSETVASIQQALAAAGVDPKGVDGGYGQNTTEAVKAFQQSRGLAATGAVDDATWQALMNRPIPPTDVRSLELTAAFEGHGYSLAVGNFDGAWLTWGIVGFTMKHGEVQKIVLAIRDQNPQLVADAFGDKAAELIAIMSASPAEQQAWANTRTSNGQLVEPWRTGFKWFGSFPAVQAEQRRLAAEDYFTPAVATAKAMGIASELGLALCFDVHVQNGGIKPAARAQIRQAGIPPGDERSLRRLIANAVADGASAKYREDVRARKLCIAEGQGRVHGHDYVLESWGLGESPAAELR
ncbi:MAG TPA: peptidoglycan-binding protein [Candidatus Methylomirabilis sp.]|nr:peptidoglycan-binding protein [Candidatus Methylomirabilis sp.]